MLQISPLTPPGESAMQQLGNAKIGAVPRSQNAVEMLPLQAGDIPDTEALSALLHAVSYRPRVSGETVSRFVGWYRGYYWCSRTD
jgi:hypothetical protein